MPETLTIYARLIGLPLFQGMSSSDLQDIVSRVRFGFRRYSKNTTIVSGSDKCDGLLFLLDGETDMISVSADHSYRVTEDLAAPGIIEPERVFGLQQHYMRTYRTRTICHLLHIGKDDVILLSSEFMVFRLNLLNIISTQSQRHQKELWRHHPENALERIQRFLSLHTATQTGKKTFHIKMRQLAAETGLTRNEVSAALNALQSAGKIILQRGIITISKMEHLRM